MVQQITAVQGTHKMPRNTSKSLNTPQSPQIPNPCPMCGCPHSTTSPGQVWGSGFWGIDAPAAEKHLLRTQLHPPQVLVCPQPHNLVPMPSHNHCHVSPHIHIFSIFWFLLLFKLMPFCRSLKATEPGANSLQHSPSHPIAHTHIPTVPAPQHPVFSPPAPSSCVVPGSTSSHHQTPPPLFYFTNRTQGTCWKSSSRTRWHHNIHRHRRLSSTFLDNPAPAVV